MAWTARTDTYPNTRETNAGPDHKVRTGYSHEVKTGLNIRDFPDLKALQVSRREPAPREATVPGPQEQWGFGGTPSSMTDARATVDVPHLPNVHLGRCEGGMPRSLRSDPLHLKKAKASIGWHPSQSVRQRH